MELWKLYAGYRTISSACTVYPKTIYRACVLNDSYISTGTYKMMTLVERNKGEYRREFLQDVPARNTQQVHYVR
jgi:hypothetical protein